MSIEDFIVDFPLFPKDEKNKTSYFAKRLFSVGPYGKRAAFGFQQRRALHFAFHFYKARNNAENDDRSKRVAILGGGIAGTTLFRALVSLGFSNVDLYESLPEVLDLQSNAIHRFIHPNYNTWPVLFNFSSTTEYPFLNWFCADAKTVLSTLQVDFKNFCRETGLMGNIHRECKIGRVDAVRGTADVCSEIKVYIEGQVRPKKYDYAISTLGFSEEQNYRGNPARGYWQSDIFDSEKRIPEKPKYIIGAGDGSLIDAIRLMWNDKVSTDPEVFKSLFLKTISYLRSHEYASPQSEVTEVEKILNLKSEERISGFEKELREIEYSFVDAETHEENLNKIEDRYVDFFNKIYTEIPEIPDIFSSVQDASAQNISLVSNSDPAFLPSSAPINKLILASKTHTINYIKGRLEEDKDSGAREFVSNGSGLELTLSENPDDYLLVSRRGAASNFENLFSYDDALKTKIRNILMTIGNEQAFNKLEEEEASTILQQLKVILHEHFPNFIDDLESQFQKAIEFFEIHFPSFGTLRRKGIGDDAKAGYFEFSYKCSEDELSNAMRGLGGFDHHIFGIPVVFIKEIESVVAITSFPKESAS